MSFQKNHVIEEFVTKTIEFVVTFSFSATYESKGDMLDLEQVYDLVRRDQVNSGYTIPARFWDCDGTIMFLICSKLFYVMEQEHPCGLVVPMPEKLSPCIDWTHDTREHMRIVERTIVSETSCAPAPEAMERLHAMYARGDWFLPVLSRSSFGK